MDLTGQVHAVTGAGSGLGLATARALVDAGATVAAVDLTLSDELAALGALYVKADVSSQESVRAAFNAIASEDNLRGLVHCAGRGGDRTRVLDQSGAPNDAASFRDVIETNLLGTYYVTQAAAAVMATNEPVDGERGAIVLTASIAAFDGQIGQTAYASAKGGVHSMTLVAARDLAAWKIRVNTIAPGVFETNMLGRFEGEVRQALASNVPFPRRLGRPQDFASLTLELLTNGYLNGETIRLDGALRLARK